MYRKMSVAIYVKLMFNKKGKIKFIFLEIMLQSKSSKYNVILPLTTQFKCKRCCNLG